MSAKDVVHDSEHDHSWFAYDPLPHRAQPTLPHNAQVAVAIVVNVTATEWEHTAAPAVQPAGGRGFQPPPDIPRLSHREFGHRAGIFRVLDALTALGITPAAVVDVLSAEQYPGLLERLLPNVSEVIAGGMSASRPITSLMTDDEEADYIASVQHRLAARTGTAPKGWLSPERSESTRTPGLLAQTGVKFVADWANDEQPYVMPGADGLVAFPLSWELDDLNVFQLRGVSARDHAASITEACSVLAASDGPRVLALHLHPWLTGQAFRIEAITSALHAIRDRDDVWLASPSEIINAWHQPA